MTDHDNGMQYSDAETSPGSGVEGNPALYSFISNDLFGHVATYVHPFSRQFKFEARRIFPADLPAYKQIDTFERKIITLYLLTRVLTFFLTFCVAVALITGRDGAIQMISRAVDVDLARSPVFEFIYGLAVIALLFAVRQVIRHYEDEINGKKNVIRLRYYTHSQDEKFNKEIVEMCNAVLRRNSPRPWRIVAKESTQNALILFVRRQYMDRYCTTALWRIHDRLMMIEVFFNLVKAAMLGVFVYSTWESDPVFTGVFATLLLILWGPFIRRENTKYSKVFTSEQVSQTTSKHAITMISEVVEELVSQIMEHVRNPQSPVR